MGSHIVSFGVEVGLWGAEKGKGRILTLGGGGVEEFLVTPWLGASAEASGPRNSAGESRVLFFGYLTVRASFGDRLKSVEDGRRETLVKRSQCFLVASNRLEPWGILVHPSASSDCLLALAFSRSLDGERTLRFQMVTPTSPACLEESLGGCTFADLWGRHDLDSPPLHVFLECGQKETRLAPPTGSLHPFRETNEKSLMASGASRNCMKEREGGKGGAGVISRKKWGTPPRFLGG